MSAVEWPTDGPDSGEPDLCAALQASLDRARRTPRRCYACGDDLVAPLDRHLRTCRACLAEADALDPDLRSGSR